MRTTHSLVIAATALLAACTSKDSSGGKGGDATYGGTLVVSGIGDAVDLFPPLVNEQNGRIVMDNVFDRIAEISQDMTTVGDKTFTPRLAKSWTWAPDSLSIAFAIDPRARWHDGKPVTAADILYTYKVDTDPKVGSPWGPLLANVDSISVRDSLTAVVWFKKRTPEQFYDVVYNLIPIPEHVYGGVAPDQFRTSDVTRKLVGSGRFRFVRWEPKVRIELIADTANYRGRAKLDRVLITPVSDPTVGMTQVMSGQTDFIESFPIDQVGKLDSSTIARALPLPTLGYAFLGFNRNARKSKTAPHAVLSDIRVRRAIAMAADRRAMLTNVFGSVGRLSYGPFPRVLSAADTTLKLPPYDTVAAKALLDSAGWKPGADGIRVKNGQRLQLGILTPATSLFRRRYAVLLQSALKTVGIQADVDTPDNTAFSARTGAGDYDMELGSYSMDPSVSGSKQNWGSAFVGQSGMNDLRYSNPKVDALLDSSLASFDASKAKAAASRAYQAIIDDVPAVFLYDILFVAAVNRRIEVVPPRSDGWWTHLADWSVPPDKRTERDRIGLGSAQP